MMDNKLGQAKTMQLDIKWCIEHKVILVTLLHPPTSDEDMVYLSDQLIHFFESAEFDKVHVLVDTHKLNGSIKIRLVSQAKFLRHRKLGWFIVIAKFGSLQRFVAQGVTRLMTISHRQCESIDEAIAFLRKADKELVGTSCQI